MGQKRRGCRDWTLASTLLVVLGRWVTEGPWVRVTCAPWCGGREPLGDRHWGTPDRGGEGTQSPREVKGVALEDRTDPGGQRWRSGSGSDLAREAEGSSLEVSRPRVASTFHGTAAFPGAGPMRGGKAPPIARVPSVGAVAWVAGGHEEDVPGGRAGQCRAGKCSGRGQVASCPAPDSPKHPSGGP